ncbi:potassium channel family protein [Nocardioides mangrovi]|uniref:Potassium channel family protein n=1 Tax=Nocardioides mangrovi TaxID=2874580 RepID=A0ABS7UBZ3_9ACTN|nr:potassium channel family protein [Nocardioides mangrovi]MBZ5738231.1 potassium channel family protein [Nocardioides mangrovi]
MTGWRRVARDIAIAVLAIVLYFVLPVGGELDRGLIERGVLSIVWISAVGAIVLWQVLRQIEQPARRVDGLVLSMLCGVLVFALAFYRLQVEDPTQFHGMSTRLDSLYFTMTTLLTVGFGDVNASGQVARFLVLLQMVFNIVVLATAATTLNNRVRENALRRAEARRNRP